MLCGQLLYQEYINENPNVVCGKDKISNGRKTISKERFIGLANTIGKDINSSTYKDKDQARKELKKKARKSTGIIEYFLLRAIIGWIIEKILSHYFL